MCMCVLHGRACVSVLLQVLYFFQHDGYSFERSGPMLPILRACSGGEMTHRIAKQREPSQNHRDPRIDGTEERHGFHRVHKVCTKWGILIHRHRMSR